ncbi:hypothetical protein [Streptomyces viridochromogenes]|uniref:hypothetical protein n=1 Tax=Streptomyces viridochromogenes TaxID=1938 RepID=UPI00131BAF21|nr:hypothetical protein [Streptomyces viridochromogenes]
MLPPVGPYGVHPGDTATSPNFRQGPGVWGRDGPDSPATRVRRGFSDDSGPAHAA